MFNSLLTSQSLTIEQFCICLSASVFCGITIAKTYTIKNTYSKSFICSLVMIPAIIQTIIMMVNGNLGTGVAIMGAFSLIRFRSTPGSSKEMSIIFLAMATGLATGMGQIWFAFLFTALMCTLFLLLHLTSFGSTPSNVKALKITLPETIEEIEILDPILNEYTSFFRLEKIKTSSLGSLFEAEYTIRLKKEVNQKQLIDKLRVCNRNLPITLTKALEREEGL